MASEEPDLFLDRNQGAKRGAYPIPLSSICTAGFLGRAQRGPVDEPVGIESFSEYLRFFGGHLSDGGLSHAVQDFFLHGGQRAVVVRVANRATRARLDLPGADGILHLQARYPGRYEVLRVSIDYERVEAEPTKFNLVVQRIGMQGTPLVEDQELYPLVSMTPSDTRYVGKILQDSRLVALIGAVPPSRPFATPPERPGDPVRYLSLANPGDDGHELSDYDIIGSNRHGTGLFAFARGPRIDLLAIPLPPERELGATALVAAARYCEARRAILIWDPPKDWQSADGALLGSRRLNFGNGSVMTYFPRIRPRGAGARYLGGLPACGAIAGMLAARDRRGLFGRDEDTDYSLRAALTPVVAVDSLQAQRLARAGINVFLPATGGSTRLVGRITLGSSGAGRSAASSLSSRRLVNFILNAIDDAVAAVPAHADPVTLTRNLQRQLQRFFAGLHQRGALKGRTPDQAYFLRISQSVPDAAGRAPELLFGIALSRPGRFEEYSIALAGEPLQRVRRVQRLEADQFFN
jgi:hypothetical protein